jgi:hypothetical protein
MSRNASTSHKNDNLGSFGSRHEESKQDSDEDDDLFQRSHMSNQKRPESARYVSKGRSSILIN